MEKDKNKLKKNKYFKWACYFVTAALFIFLLFWSHDYLFGNPSYENRSTDKDIYSDSSNFPLTSPDDPSTDEDTNQSSQQNDNTNAEKYYSDSLDYANNKSYSQAIVEINKAIELDSSVDIYWAKKASYQALLGNIDSEKATLEEGLKIIPNSDLLKTRLEIVGVDISSGAGGIK